MKNLVIVVLVGFIAFSYAGRKSNTSIFGKWRSTGVSNETLTFKSDGTISEIADVKYEVITSVTPSQIYFSTTGRKGEVIRVPMGIYKIQGNKMVIAYAKHFERTLNGIPFGGISRVEIPKDFSGEEVVEYLKVN